MTPDLTTRAVEIIEDELCDGLDESLGPALIAAQIWRALLAARTNEVCGTCGGKGTDQSDLAVSRFTHTGNLTDCPNAECNNGRVRGDRLLVAILMEQVGWRDTDGWLHPMPTHEDGDVPVYVERPVDQQ